jgi:hypothetical protein
VNSFARNEVDLCLGKTAEGQQLRMHSWRHDLQIRPSWEIREEREQKNGTKKMRIRLLSHDDRRAYEIELNERSSQGRQPQASGSPRGGWYTWSRSYGRCGWLAAAWMDPERRHTDNLLVPPRYRCFWRRQLHDQLVHARCSGTGHWWSTVAQRKALEAAAAAAAATRKGPRA